MDPAVIGVKVASSVATPLVRRLFVTTGPAPARRQAGVPPGVRLLRGEKRALSDKELTKLAAGRVERAVDADGERPLPEDETPAALLAPAPPCAPRATSA